LLLEPSLVHMLLTDIDPNRTVVDDEWFIME
jgi:hypothetical protein